MFTKDTLTRFQQMMKRIGLDKQSALREVWLKQTADRETFGEFVLRTYDLDSQEKIPYTNKVHG